MSFENIPQKNSGEKKENKTLKIAFVDESSNVESESMDRADEKMTASKEEMKGMKGLWRRIWHHNLAQPYYRRKEYEKVRKEILERKSIFKDENKKKEHEESLIKQFASEYEEAIHTEVGEKREILGESEEEKNIKDNIKKLVLDYAKGDIDEECFLEEKNRIFSQIKGVKKEIIDKGDLYSSNILEIAKQVKQSIEHGESLDNLDLDFEVVIGKAKSGVRTEAQFNKLDRVIEKIQKSKIGSFVNETTVSTAASIAYCVAIGLSKKFANSKLMSWGSFGATALLGSGIAAAREKKRLEEERRQHAREMAQGKKFESGSKRREEMEKFRYETKDASNLSDELEYYLYNFNEKGERKIKSLDQQGFQDAVGKLAEIEARIKISDRQKIDLIRFSDKSGVTKERLRLDLLRAAAKKDLEKILNSGQIIIPGGKTFSEFLDLVFETKVSEIMGGESGVERKNELFKKMRNKKVFKAGIKGLISGLVVGGAAQEIGALFRDGQEGLVENFLVGKANAQDFGQPASVAQSYTILEYARRWITGNLPRMDASKIHEVIIGGNHIKLPEGANLIQNSDGTYNLLRGSDVVAGRLKFNPDGSLSEEAKKILADKGVKFNSDSVASGPKNIVQNYEKITSRIKRMLWYDNDTPKPVFDKNELKLWWGGIKGTGIDSDGNYIFNIKHMTSDGSYHGKFSIDAQEAMKSGKLKMLLSLSRDTQNKVFEVPIDSKGNAIIDPKSEIGKIFFAQEGGKAKFLGKYAEVAEMMGKKDDVDQVRILATHVGKGIESSMKNLSVFNLPADYHVEPPPFVTIAGRRPMEKVRKEIEYLGGGYFEVDPRNKQFFRERRSKKLENPDAELNHFEEIRNYLERLPKERMEDIKKLSGQIKEPMDSECRLSICIPIAGHQEGNNIYKTLSEFKNQVDENGNDLDYKKFEILAFVNHPKDKKPDNTIDEIRRFQNDNPNIQVRMVYKQLDRESGEVAIGNIRKIATDISLFRHHKRGPETKDLIIVSNDADCEGMSRRYVSGYISDFDQNQHIDSMLGKIDWDPMAYVKSPSFYVGTRLFQFLDIIRRHGNDPRKKNIGSSGANFAFKSSIYAAVGGYIEVDRKCEDVDLGNMIKYARAKGKIYKPISFARDKSIIYTNARRGIDAMKKGLAPAEMWNEGFGPDDAIRSMNWKLEEEEDIKKLLDSEEYLEKLRQTIEIFISRTFKEYGININDLEKEIKKKNLHLYSKEKEQLKEVLRPLKALNFLGVRYIIKDNQIRITDISRMIKKLKNYQKLGPDIFKRKITNGK